MVDFNVDDVTGYLDHVVQLLTDYGEETVNGIRIGLKALKCITGHPDLGTLITLFSQEKPIVEDLIAAVKKFRASHQ